MKKSIKIIALLAFMMLTCVALDMITGENFSLVSLATAGIVLTDIPFEMGKPNGSGVGHYLYYCPLEDIASWPTISDDMAAATSDATYVGYTGDFTLKDGKTWIKIFNVQGEGVMTFEDMGEKCSKLFNNKLHYRFPKMTDAAIKKAKATVNVPGVYIAWHDGAYRVVGNKHYFGDTKISGTSGDSAGSSKGTTIDAECPDYTPLPVYSGDLALSDGTLDCSTDTFTPADSTD